MIRPTLFYSKREKLRTCIPKCCVESDGSSSDSDNEIIGEKKQNERKSTGVIADPDSECDSDGSQKSEERWPRATRSADVIVPMTDDSSDVSSPLLSQCSDMSMPLSGVDTSPETELKKKYRAVKDVNGNDIPMKSLKGKDDEPSKKISSVSLPLRPPVSSACPVLNSSSPVAVNSSLIINSRSKKTNSTSLPSRIPLATSNLLNVKSSSVNLKVFSKSKQKDKENVPSPKSKGLSKQLSSSKRSRLLLQRAILPTQPSTHSPVCLSSTSEIPTNPALKRDSVAKGSDSDAPSRKQPRAQGSSSEDESLLNIQKRLCEQKQNANKAAAIKEVKGSDAAGSTSSKVSSNNQKDGCFSPSVTLEMGKASIVTSSPFENIPSSTFPSPGMSPVVPEHLNQDQYDGNTELFANDMSNKDSTNEENCKRNLRPKKQLTYTCGNSTSEAESENWPSPNRSHSSNDFMSLLSSSSVAGSEGSPDGDISPPATKSTKCPKPKVTNTGKSKPPAAKSSKSNTNTELASSIKPVGKKRPIPSKKSAQPVEDFQFSPEENVDSPDSDISIPQPTGQKDILPTSTSAVPAPVKKVNSRQRKCTAQPINDSVSRPNSILVEVSKGSSTAEKNAPSSSRAGSGAQGHKATSKGKAKTKAPVAGNWIEEDIEVPWQAEKVLFTIPENPENMKEPIDYFKYYFDAEAMELLVHQTNLYILQDCGENWSVTESDLYNFIGIQIYMGICSLPSIRDYWAGSTLVPQVADIMPRSKFEKIRSHIHFHDNSSVDPEETDRMIKIRPLIKSFRTKCQLLEEEAEQCVDECMVGYKGTRAGSARQYMPDKPSSKWGFKIFSRNGKSGLMYDFIPYYGSHTFDNEHLSADEADLGAGAQAVIALCKSMKNPSSTTLTFDNYYTGLPLLSYLKDEMNILSLGTVKANRTGKCPLKEDKELLKQGRGSYDFRKNESGVFVLKWADNKAVCLASTKVGVMPLGTIPRYDKDAGKKIPVPCPKIVLEYNATMGGVDLFDQYMSLYKSPTRARRWYFPLFGFLLELALINSFLLYKREHEIVGAELTYPTFKEFRLKVFHGLTAVAHASKGRPTLDKSLLKRAGRSRKPKLAVSDEVRTDNVGHFVSRSTRGRCAYCAHGHTFIYCAKCNKRLCVTENRNCFAQFHMIKVLPDHKPKK